MLSRRERVKDLFQQATERPPGERGAFLDSACGQDEQLRREVDTLLHSYAQAGEFLAEPTGEPPAEVPGTVIDRYKLLQEIGEGGFGVVWMAEQVEPVRRRVALKVIKLGMDTRQVVARFEAERQALAMMDHPNIAKVLDGGATASGRPYFAMELVRGVPITEYCDHASLSPRERIELFRQVCQAVQHAHQKGVIHRDLKPSNILVTLHDGVPVPKVIDFGVAKATSQELTQKTLFTEFRQMVGTPEYMAPEQAELSGLDVDTRADVYSLGVILYELLTGTKPFDLRSMLEKGYLEMLRYIREVEPQKPSTRLSTLGELLPAVARHRQTEPQKLGHLIRGDLDWIAMKALEKDRSRRYPTASALADDLQRYLEDLPVEAVRPGAVYRLAKFARRNKVSVAATLAVFASLVAGVVGTSVSLHRALTAEETSRIEAKRAESVVQLIQDMLGAADPHSVKGPDYTVRELLDDFDSQLGQRLEQEPAVEADIRTTMGIAYRNLGYTEKAEGHIRAAMHLREQEFGEDHEAYSESLLDWSWVLHEQGDYDAAQKMMRRALEIAQQRDLEPEKLAERLYGLGDFYRHNGNYVEAEKNARESLALLEGTERKPGFLAPNMNILGLVLQNQGRYEEAEAIFREVLMIRYEEFGREHLHVASALNSLGSILRSLGRYEEAVRTHREALAMRRKLVGEGHTLVGVSLNNLAAVLKLQGRYEEAESHFREAHALFRANLGEEHPFVGHVLNNIATVLNQQGHYSAAEELHREELALLRGRHGDGHRDVATTIRNLAIAIERQGRHVEAEALHREALVMYRKVLGERHPDVAMATADLAASLNAQGLHGDAEDMFREALAQVRELLDEGHPNMPIVLEGLGSAILAQGRHAEAEPLLLDAYEKFTAQQGPEAARRQPRLVQQLIDLYDGWNAAGGDTAERESHWRAELERIRR